MIYLFGGVLAAVVLALAALVVLPRRHGIRRSMPAAPRTLADIVSSVSTGLDGIRRKLSRQAVSGPRADSVRRGLQERRRLHMGTPPLRSRATTKLHDLVPRRGVPDREFHQQHRPESVPRQASTRSGAVGTRHFAGTGRPLRSLASGTAAVSRERSLRMAVAVETGPSAAGSQDAYVIQNGIIAVARGVSGTSIDHRAAALALSAVISARPQDTDDAAHALQDCVATANRTIRAISQRDPELSGMVTTLDVVCLAPGTKSSMLHFAHVGNSTIWLQRRGRTVVRLTERHAFGNGPLLRAVGMVSDLVPDIGCEPIMLADRIFITTESPTFAFSDRLLNEIAHDYAEEPLQECAAALGYVPVSARVDDAVTVVAAEVTDTGVVSVQSPISRIWHG